MKIRQQNFNNRLNTKCNEIERGFMDKFIKIDGRLIQVFSKTIEINGDPVVTQGDIKIINEFNGEAITKVSETEYAKLSQDELYAA